MHGLRIPLLLTVLVTACAGNDGPAATGTTPSTPSFVEAVVHGPCRAEYLPDVGMTGFAFRVEGVGDFAAAVVGDGFTFVCEATGNGLVRAQNRGTERSAGIQIDDAPADDVAMSDHLSSVIEAANAQLVEAGFTIVQRVGPRALTEDTVVMAIELSKDGRSGTQFVVMRGLRTSAGILRYTAIEWGEDPSRIETTVDALYRASRAFMPINR